MMEIYDITHSLYMDIVYTSAYLHTVLLKFRRNTNTTKHLELYIICLHHMKYVFSCNLSFDVVNMYELLLI